MKRFHRFVLFCRYFFLFLSLSGAIFSSLTCKESDSNSNNGGDTIDTTPQNFTPDQRGIQLLEGDITFIEGSQGLKDQLLGDLATFSNSLVVAVPFYDEFVARQVPPPDPMFVDRVTALMDEIAGAFSYSSLTIVMDLFNYDYSDIMYPDCRAGASGSPDYCFKEIMADVVNFSYSPYLTAITNQALEVVNTYRPNYFILGVNVNRYKTVDAEDYPRLLDFYKTLYAAIKAASPSTLVSLSFDYDYLKLSQLNTYTVTDAEAEQKITQASKAYQDLIAPVISSLDFFAATSYPKEAGMSGTPDTMPADHYKALETLAAGKDLFFHAIGWLASNDLDIITQQNFVKAFKGRIKHFNLLKAAWKSLYPKKISHCEDMFLSFAETQGYALTDGYCLYMMWNPSGMYQPVWCEFKKEGAYIQKDDPADEECLAN